METMSCLLSIHRHSSFLWLIRMNENISIYRCNLVVLIHQCFIEIIIAIGLIHLLILISKVINKQTVTKPCLQTRQHSLPSYITLFYDVQSYAKFRRVNIGCRSILCNFVLQIKKLSSAKTASTFLIVFCTQWPWQLSYNLVTIFNPWN